MLVCVLLFILFLGCLGRLGCVCCLDCYLCWRVLVLYCFDCLNHIVCGIVCIVLSICVALDLGLDCSDALVFIVRIRFLNVWIVLTVYIAS